MNDIVDPSTLERAAATVIDEIFFKIEEKFELPLELQFIMQDVLDYTFTDPEMLQRIIRVEGIEKAITTLIKLRLDTQGAATDDALREANAELTEKNAQLTAENIMLGRDLKNEVDNAIRLGNRLQQAKDRADAEKRRADQAHAASKELLRKFRVGDKQILADRLAVGRREEQKRADKAIAVANEACFALVDLAERAVAEANRKVVESHLWAGTSVARIMRMADIEIACVRKDSELMEAEMRSRFSKAFATVRAKSAKQREKERISDLEAIATRDGRIAGLEAINAKHLTERLQVDNTEVLAMLGRFEELLGDGMLRMAEDNSDAANFRTEIREATHEMKAAVFSVVGELRGLLDNDVPVLKTAVQAMLDRYDAMLKLVSELFSHLQTVHPLMQLAVRTMDEGIENVRTEYEIMRRTTTAGETKQLNASVRLLARIIAAMDPKKISQDVQQEMVTVFNSFSDKMEGIVVSSIAPIDATVGKLGEVVHRTDRLASTMLIGSTIGYSDVAPAERHGEVPAFLRKADSSTEVTAHA